MLVISGVLLFIGSFLSTMEGSQLKEQVLVGEFPKDCTETKPVSSNYTGQGKIWNLEDLPIYETVGDGGNSNRVLLLAYDIFGFHPNTFRVADRLAGEGGFRVVIPDFFRGEPFPEDKYPIKDMAELYQFIDTKGNWDKTVKADTERVLAHYKNLKTPTFAILGMCWGGMVAAAAAGQLPGEFKVAAMVHPSGITLDLVKDISLPTYLITCAGDPDLNDCYIVLQQKLGTHCGYKRFNDVHHGFAAARGNFSDPIVAARINEVISTVKTFFNENL